MGKVFKAINILLSIGLIFIALGIAYIAIPQFGNKALIVRSGSMEPTISVGSIVVVRASSSLISPTLVNSAPYGKGDIIAFRSEKNSKTIITHRVVAVEKSGNGVVYKTKGDANEEMDGWTVQQKNVLGKSYFVLPAFGKVLEFAKSKAGFPILIIFPAAFVIILELFNIIREIRKNKTPKEPEFSWSGFKILIPLLLIGISIPVAFAFPSDTETSVDNVLTASNDFGINPTLTPSPSATPSATPTINLTPP
ncbi:MAG: signal peptidase I [Patescibacteria group bacterium]